MLRTLASLVILTASIRSLPDVSDSCATLVVAASGYYCASCLQPVYCDIGPPLITVELAECDSGEVCESYTPGAAECVPIIPTTQCYCTSNMCDPFNPDYSAVCGTAGISDIEDCVSLTQECASDAGSCVSCESFGAGWRPITPACTAGYKCDKNNAVVKSNQCPVGNYVNEDGKCATSPPTPCASSCSIYCPDLTDCTRYYACDGSGGVVGGDYPCSSGSYFNPDGDPAPDCQTDSALCSPWTECDFDSSTVTDTTTTTPDSTATTTTATTPDSTATTTTATTPDSTATATTATTPDSTATTTTITATTTTTGSTLPPCTDDNQNHKYACNSCSSCYMSCKDTGGGDYEYVQMDCPGDLVFNTDPYYPYCDYSTNVTGCA